MTRRAVGIGAFVVVASGLAAGVSAAWWQQSGAGTGLIAFLSTRDGQGGLFVMNGDGSGPRRLTTGSDLFHAWSPDGSRIAFSRSSTRQVRTPDGQLVTAPGGVNIFSVGIDGSGLTQLTHDGQSAAPAWSRACH